MKIPLTYGALMAIASALLTLVLFLLGYHSDPARLNTVQTFSTIMGIAVNIIGISLGMRAKRAEIAPENTFTYGQALGVGVVIGVCAAFYSGLFTVLYSTVINPGFTDIIMQQQIAKYEAKGMSGDQIEKTMGVMHMMFKPPIQFGIILLFGTFWSLLVSLIAAAFLKRPESTYAPPPLRSA